MNKAEAVIIKIQSVDTINIVSFDVNGQTMSMMALALDERVAKGTKVIMGAKATNIILAKARVEMMSVANQLEVSIKEIKMGELLCNVHFDLAGELWESTITRESAEKMKLRVGESVVAFINSSDLLIMETL